MFENVCENDCVVKNIVKERICVLSVCCSICLSEHYNSCYETDDGFENSK